MSEEQTLEELREELKASHLREETTKHIYNQILEYISSTDTKTNLVPYRQELALSENSKIEEFYESRISQLKEAHSRQVEELKTIIKDQSRQNKSLTLQIQHTEIAYEKMISKLRQQSIKPSRSYSDIQKLCLVKNHALAKAEYFKSKLLKEKDSFLGLKKKEALSTSFSNIEESFVCKNDVQENERLATKGRYFKSDTSFEDASTMVFCDEKVQSLEKYAADLLSKLYKIDEDRCLAKHNERKASMELRKRVFEAEMHEQEIVKLESKLSKVQQAIEFGGDDIKAYLQQIMTEKILME